MRTANDFFARVDKTVPLFKSVKKICHFFYSLRESVTLEEELCIATYDIHILNDQYPSLLFLLPKKSSTMPLTRFESEADSKKTLPSS